MGRVYDAASNVLYDGANNYLYDVEGRLCAVQNVAIAGIPMTGYLYGADGWRVAKGTLSSWTCNAAATNFSPTSIYVLGASGEQMTEVAISGSTTTWRHTNVFAGGKLLATYAPNTNGATDTFFTLTDWLGTKRAEITPDNTFSTFFSLPYGNGLSTAGDAADAAEHHFTGKERDTESGSDYFEARYYGSGMGRFLSPDPSGLFYADPSNPQSLNLYSYAQNNPLKNTDPDGLRCVWDDGSFDSEDDKQTGKQSDCEAAGGRYEKPGTYAPGVDWASTNQDGTLSLHGVTGSAQSVTVTGTITGITADTSLWATGYLSNVGLAYANVSNYLTGGTDIPYYRFFMTHYCGPGGAGDPTGVMDRACKAHDECYAAAGLDASANTSSSTSLSLQQASAAQGCNQALYNAARSNPQSSGSNTLRLWLTKGDQTPFRGHILAPGTEAKQW